MSARSGEGRARDVALTRFGDDETPDPMADLRAGMEAVLRAAVVPFRWTSPDERDYPTLSTEREMGEVAAALLAYGERPWRVVRSLARRWPEWRDLLPALVRAVVENARRAAR